MQDVISITEHIQYLTSRYDCVAVPSLGAFIAQNESARMIDGGTRMMPPMRTLTFNSAIAHDDGLLVGSVARKEGISYEFAREEVAQAVELLLHRVRTEGEADIVRVGKLTYAGSEMLVFTPSDNNAASMRYRGLPALSLRPVEQAGLPEMLEVAIEPVGRGRRILRGVGRYAAAVALLLGIGITFTTPLIVDEHEVVQASTAPRITAPRHAVVEKVVDAPAVEAADESEILQTLPDVISAQDFDADRPDGYGCYVIVASCASESEARKYVANQRKYGENLRILPSGGRYRVYVAVGKDYDAAYAYKSTDSDIVSRYPEAWVYVR